MDEYSNLKGGVAGTTASDRIWGVPQKRKTEDRNSANGRPRKETLVKSREAEQEPEHEESLEAEETCYGSHGTRRKRNRQVDVTI